MLMRLGAYQPYAIFPSFPFGFPGFGSVILRVAPRFSRPAYRSSLSIVMLLIRPFNSRLTVGWCSFSTAANSVCVYFRLSAC